MTTASGSPTQNRTAETTPRDLAGVPDDAFKEGDLGYVSSLWPDATFRLRRAPLPSPANNVTTIETNSGNGYWELFAQSSEVPSFARIENLATFVEGLSNGSIVYVQSLRSYFQKVFGPDLGTDGITSVRNAVNDATWYRLPVRSISWERRASWYIDVSTGNDQSPGTNLEPLQTFAEFARRVQDVYGPVIVYIVSDTREVLRGTFFGKTPTAAIRIEGSVTIVDSGNTTVFTAASPTTNTLGTVTCAEIPSFAPYVGKMLRTSRVTGQVETTHVIKAAGNVATIGGVFAGGASIDNPVANGRPLQVIEIPEVETLQIDSYGLAMTTIYLRSISTSLPLYVRATGILGSYLTSCEVLGDIVLPAFRVLSGSLFTGSGKKFLGDTSPIAQGIACLFNGCTGIGRDWNFDNGVRVNLQGAIVYSASALLGSPDGTGPTSRACPSAGNFSFGVFESPGDAMTVYPNACIGGLWYFGKDNAGYGMVVKKGARVLQVAAYVPKVTGASGDLLFRDSSVAIPRLVATANVPAALPLTSWAQFVASFSSRVMSYSDGTVLSAVV